MTPVTEQLQLVNQAAMRRGLAVLKKMFTDRYPAADHLAARIDELEKQLPSLIQDSKTTPDQATLKRAEAGCVTDIADARKHVPPRGLW